MSSEKFAIVSFNNIQHKLEEGNEYDFPRFENKPGQKMDLDEVLLLVDGDKTEIGTPILKNNKVEIEVVGDLLGIKVRTLKYKAKARYRKRSGHREKLTKIKVIKIK